MSQVEWAYQYGDNPMVRCSREWAAGLVDGAGAKPTIYARREGGEWVATDPGPDQQERPSAGPTGTRVQGPVTGSSGPPQ